MKSTMYSRGALSVAVTAISLAGCSGTQPPAGGPSASVAMTTRSAIVPTMRSQPQRTWMTPALKGRRDLFYISDPGDGLVIAYDYKSGKQLGSAGGFKLAYGGCSDAKGNVYFVDFNASKITEFAARHVDGDQDAHRQCRKSDRLQRQSNQRRSRRHQLPEP